MTDIYTATRPSARAARLLTHAIDPHTGAAERAAYLERASRLLHDQLDPGHRRPTTTRALPGPAPAAAALPARHPAFFAVQVAAAGGHHLALLGPGPYASVAAVLLHRLLPDLDPATAAQAADLRTHAGLPPADPALRHRPPWQAPPADRPATDLLGSRRGPGAASLAHGGVLFCDHAEHLTPMHAASLRPVLDQRRVWIRHGHDERRWPARVQLVLAAGCHEQREGTCRRCTHLALLLDRVDVRAQSPAGPATPAAVPDDVVLAAAVLRVAAARASAAARWACLGHRYLTNADASRDALAATDLPAGLRDRLRHGVHVGSLSDRGALGALRVAFTVADLRGHPLPTGRDLTEALALRGHQPALPA